MFPRGIEADGYLDLENTAPRIKSDFRPQNGDIIQKQKQKLLRKERRLKRIFTVLGGYAVMAWMVYLIIVTARTSPKIWDPYEILGISRVSLTSEQAILRIFLLRFGKISNFSCANFYWFCRAPTRKLFPDTLKGFPSGFTQTKSDRIQTKMKPSKA